MSFCSNNFEKRASKYYEKGNTNRLNYREEGEEIFPNKYGYQKLLLVVSINAKVWVNQKITSLSLI